MSLVAPFIQGSTAYSARELVALYVPYLGESVSHGAVASIAEAIERRYQGDGFVAPVVTVDPATELTSTPRFFVYEPAISAVRIRGDAGPNQSKLMQYVHGLETMRPLHKERTRAYLSAMQRLPGVGVRAAFEADDSGMNQYILVLEIAYRPVSGSMEMANRGTRASGRELASGQLVLNGFLKQREFLTLEGALSSSYHQYHYVGAGITRAIGGEWLSLTASDAHAQPWAAEDFYDRNRYALQILHLGPDHGALRLSSAFRFVASDSLLRNTDFGPLSRDRIRKLEAGVALARNSDSPSRSRLSATLVQGLSGLGAEGVSFDDVPASDPEFTRLMLTGEQSIPLRDRTTLVARFDGSYAFDAVPTSEQFTFGGVDFGRGLEAADLAGESGAALTLDIERRASLGSRFPMATFYAGLDYGYAWHTNAGYARDHAVSSSIGVSLDHAGLSSSFELAYPLHRPHFAETSSGVAAFVDLAWSF